MCDSVRPPRDHVKKHRNHYSMSDSYRAFLQCNYDMNTVKLIERITRGQSNNQNWHAYREGAITASLAKQVCRLSSNDTPINNMLNTLLYRPNIQTTATQWGLDQEDTALDWYTDEMSDFHNGFSYRRTGLYMSTESTLIGASPDGLCYCKCCPHPYRKWLVEVKSPYNSRFLHPEDALTKTGAFYFDEDRRDDALKADHKWNYQIQLQMALADVESCDLVISTTRGISIVYVYRDEAFYSRMMSKLIKFIDTYLYPKLYDPKGFLAWDAQPGYLQSVRRNLGGAGSHY